MPTMLGNGLLITVALVIIMRSKTFFKQVMATQVTHNVFD